MYMDGLDGRINHEFFDRKAGEHCAEECRILRDIQAHQSANQSYINEGIRILELAHRAPQLFESQSPEKKRKLLDSVLSNRTYKERRLEAKYRQSFDLIVAAAQTDRANSSGGEGRKQRF
jgi:hypothetical protein